MPPFSTIAGTGHEEPLSTATSQKRPMHKLFSLMNNSKNTSSPDNPSATQYSTIVATQQSRLEIQIDDSHLKLESSVHVLLKVLEGSVGKECVDLMRQLSGEEPKLKRAQLYVECLPTTSRGGSSGGPCASEEEVRAIWVLVEQAWDALFYSLKLQQWNLYKQISGMMDSSSRYTGSSLRRAKLSKEYEILNERLIAAEVGFKRCQRHLRRLGHSHT